MAKDGKVAGSEPGQSNGQPARRDEDGLPIVVNRSPEAPAAKPIGAVRGLLWKVRFVPLAMALVMTGGIIGLYFQPPGLQKVFGWLKLTPGGGTSTPIAVPVPRKSVSETAGAPRQRLVAGLGKLVPTGDVMVIAPPYGAADARIARMAVSEGDRVTKGQLLAVLDNEPALEAFARSARATVSAREAAIVQTRASVTASRDEARAALERAEATSRNAQLELQRVEALFTKGYSSDAAYQQKRTVRDEAGREVEKAKATLSRWDSVDLDQHPDVVLAMRNLDSAKADLSRAVGDLEKAHVTAPIDATVLTIHVRPGEKPGTKGILNIGNIDKMTVEIEVYQAQIGAIAIGNAVEVTAEALPSLLKGAVTRIGLEVGRQVLTDPNPAANTDARVIKVYADLEPESSQIAQRFTNLQVTARIAVKPQT